MKVVYSGIRKYTEKGLANIPQALEFSWYRERDLNSQGVATGGF